MRTATAAPGTAIPAPAGTDARPILPRTTDNLWTQAESVRDEVYRHFVAAAASAGIDPLILKSGPYVYPAWVTFEAWTPAAADGKTSRGSARVTIEPKPYCPQAFECDVQWTIGARSGSVRRVVSLDAGDVQALVAHVLRTGKKPRFTVARLAAWQVWRPRNEVKGLRSLDWLSLGFLAAIAGGFAFPPLWLGLVPLFLVARRRRQDARNSGKPSGEPRVLARVDSWQTVLFNLGDQAQTVRDLFLQTLRNDADSQVRHETERVWYWGLDGKEEREQITVRTGRAIVFCQIYRYGRDLYVGWDGHLNRGQWVEKTVRSGIESGTGSPVALNWVVPGVQPNTEYDLMDLSCLMEWTHAQLARLLKQLIAEYRIDQEIDFTVQRGERQTLLAADTPQRRGLRARFGGGKKVERVA